MRASLFSAASVVIFWANACFANQFPVQARLFVGMSKTNPTQLNQELTTQGLQEFSNISIFGIEATYSVTSMLDVGLNYTKRQLLKDETDSNPSTDYQGLLNQDSAFLIARVPFLKTDILRLDAFAGVGGSNTSFKLKTASQDGELTRREGGDWFASICTRFGASAAIGYKRVYLVVEGGSESNKVDSFKRTGNVNANIQTIDLSGGYFTIGLLFDGIPATSK